MKSFHEIRIVISSVWNNCVWKIKSLQNRDNINRTRCLTIGIFIGFKKSLLVAAVDVNMIFIDSYLTRTNVSYIRFKNTVGNEIQLRDECFISNERRSHVVNNVNLL